MRLPLTVTVLLSALACDRGAAPAPAPVPAPPPAGDEVEAPAPEAGASPLLAAESAWTARSADGRVEVSHAAAPGGRCALVAIEVATGARRWTSDACVAWRTDRVFVSPDGERLLVLRRAPQAESPDWSAVAVASLLERGREVRAFAGRELVERRRISSMRGEESWAWGLDPHGGGPPPAYAAGGRRVRIETIDGRAIYVGFDGAISTEQGMEVTAATLGGPARDDEVGLYRWTDDAGEIHFGHGAAIPERYRARAEPVRSEVGVVGVDRRSPGWAGRPPPGAPGGPPPLPPLVDPAEEHLRLSREAAASRPPDPPPVQAKPQHCITIGSITACRTAN
jgi:hypothetical protein